MRVCIDNKQQLKFARVTLTNLGHALQAASFCVQASVLEFDLMMVAKKHVCILLFVLVSV